MWHPYWEWEDYRAGMYAGVDPRSMLTLSRSAVPFMSDIETWGAWMMKVVSEWPRAAEQNVLCVGSGRRAWVGQASMCLWRGQPGAVTKNAWWRLTEGQQRGANAAADAAIAFFHGRLGIHQLSLFDVVVAL